MTHKVKIDKILDGPRNYQIHVYIESDGGSADLVDYTLIDPHVDLDPTKDALPCLTLERIQFSMSGVSAKLEWDYLTSDNGAWVLPKDTNSDMNFQQFCAGIRDRSESDGSGKLQISTVGLSAAGSFASMIINVRKD